MSDITDANPATEDVIDAIEDAVDTSTAEAAEVVTDAVDEVVAAEEAAADEITEDTSSDIDEAGDQAESDDTASDDTASDEAASADDASSDEAEEEAPARRRRDSPYDRPGRWYVIHTQSGYENKVRSNLLARTQSMNMEERIFEVVIPLEDVVEFKNGKKVIVQKKVFPGYLLTRMHLDDDSWFVVRNTPGVTGFIGAGNKPSPLPRRDVETFLSVKEDGDEPSRRGRPRLEYTMGETVRVKEGPFADFQGEIVEINEDQLRLKVLVNIFGRETPVELQFAEVAKI